MHKFLILLSLFMLISCDSEFGDKTQDFVNDEVPEISEKLAQTTFRKNTYQAFMAQYSELAIVLELLGESYEQLRNVKVNDVSGFNQAISERQRVMSGKNKALRHLSLVQTSKLELAKLDDVCTDISPDLLRGIVTKDIFMMTIPPEEEYFYFSTDAVEALVKNIVNFIANNKFNEQVEKMEKAVDSIPDKLPSKEQLKQFYQQMCSEVAEEYSSKQENQKFRKALSNYEILFQNLYKQYQKAQDIYGNIIHRYAFEQIAAETGSADVFIQAEKDKFITKVKDAAKIYVDQQKQIQQKIINAESKSTALLEKAKWQRVYRSYEKFVDSLANFPELQAKYHEVLRQRQKLLDNIMTIVMKRF